MQRCTLRWVLAASFFLVLNTGQQGVAVRSAAAEPPKKTTAAPQTESKAKVEGFRAAHFGMTKAEVLQAIKTDFKIAKDAVVQDVNVLEKTTSLSITVSDMIPDSGPARVVYIFGYKSKNLIQVNVLWGKPVDPNPEASVLVVTATILRGYFVQQGFDKDKMVVDGRLEDGTLLVFRGADDTGRTVLLLLNVPRDNGDTEAATTPAKPGKKALADAGREVSLRLSYIENITSPDIFQIKKGKF